MCSLLSVGRSVLFALFVCTLSTCATEFNATDWQVWSHDYIVAQYFQKRQFMRTSNLGAILFKNELFYMHPRRSRFLIYVHRSPDLQLQFNLTKKLGQSVLKSCSVKNCEFMDDPRFIMEAEAVVASAEGPPPAAAERPATQLWVLLALVSPVYVTEDMIDQLADLFNWTMSYRTESDVPIPYGRTLPLLYPATANLSLDALTALVPHWQVKQRDVLAAALLSNCRAESRLKYLNTLKLYMRVHYYGSCYYRKPNIECPKYGECSVIRRYLFYLAFENSECSELMTDRVFMHALLNGAIPVVLGATRAQCELLLPPGSFLHARDYATHRDLARHMTAIANNHEHLMKYHMWRRHFTVRSESSWVSGGGARLCRLCEALNYNPRHRRSYDTDELRHFLSPTHNCQNLVQ